MVIEFRYEIEYLLISGRNLRNSVYVTIGLRYRNNYSEY